MPSKAVSDAVTTILQQQLVQFKIVENGPIFELWVADDQIDQATQLLNTLSRPTVHAKTSQSFALQQNNLQAFPITLLFIFLGVLGFAIERYLPTWFYRLTFTQVWLFDQDNWQLIVRNTYLKDIEFWRLLTPVFLHFGFFHILINGLSLWELGRRIEKVMSAVAYISLLIILGVASNAIQYLYSQSAFFGGLSGIVCGLMAFQYFLYKKSGLQGLYMPKNAYIATLGLLVIMPIVAKILFNVNFANAAHFGGLAVGALLAWVFPVKRLKHKIRE